MQTLKLIIEIALDDNDTDAKHAKDIVTNPHAGDDCTLFVGDSEFIVVSLSLD